MKIRQLMLIGALLAVPGLLWLALSPSPESRQIPPAVLGQPAEPFAGADLLTGEPVDLRAYAGQVVLVNFWATGCTECAREHGNLLRLQTLFGHYPDFAVLGVLHGDAEENGREFLSNYGNAYSHVADPSGEIASAYGVRTVPQTVLIDRDGTVRCRQTGPIMLEDWAKVASRWVPALLLDGELASCA